MKKSIIILFSVATILYVSLDYYLFYRLKSLYTKVESIKSSHIYITVEGDVCNALLGKTKLFENDFNFSKEIIIKFRTNFKCKLPSKSVCTRGNNRLTLKKKNPPFK